MKSSTTTGLMALLACASLQGCLQPAQDGTSCMNTTTLTAEKVLTPSDPEFVLATENKAAVVNDYCTIDFSLTVRFDHDSLQASAPDVFEFPLVGLADSTVFFLDDSVALSRDLTTLYNTVRLSAAPGLPGAAKYDMGYGKYSIRTRLAPGITNPDSSIRVSGQLRYRHH
jgi:hypothetical protein